MKWPIYKGEYKFGSEDNPVCINTLGTQLKEISNDNFAILGMCMTENIGIEKIMVNIVSNPNIRYVILCGEEVQGHIPGMTFKALYENGIDENGKIINAPGAIPYIENISNEIIEEFCRQVEIIDMIGNTNEDEITKKAQVLIAKNPEPYPMKIDLDSLVKEDKEISADEEYVSLCDIKLLISSINTKIDILTRMNSHKLESFVLGYILGGVLILIMRGLL